MLTPHDGIGIDYRGKGCAQAAYHDRNGVQGLQIRLEVIVLKGSIRWDMKNDAITNGGRQASGNRTDFRVAPDPVSQLDARASGPRWSMASSLSAR